MGNAIAFDAREFLTELVGDVKDKERRMFVGKRLAERLGRDAPFSESYIYNAVKGHQEISNRGELYLALRATWMHKNGGHPTKGAMERVTVYAVPGTVEEGSILLQESRRCDYLPCSHPFVPKSGNQDYCSSECRRAARKARGW